MNLNGNVLTKLLDQMTRTLGAYGPLVLAPAEGLGALQDPCKVEVILSFVFLYFCLLALLPFCLFVFLSFCILASLIVCLFVFLSFCLSVFLSFCLSVFLSFCLSAFLSFLSFCLLYSTVQCSNRRGGWCKGVAHSIFHSMCVVSVTGAASLVAECITNSLF